MADTTTELEVLDQIVGVLGGQSGQYETVVPVLQQIKELLAAGITDPEAIAAAVTAWLDEHPEATTTVRDGSITVMKLAEDVVELLDNKADIDGYNPALSVGRADALTGADDTAQWATRESTGSGTAIVRSVQGASEVQDGELVPVRMAGMRSTGRNLIDLKNPYGSGAYNQEAGYQIAAGTPSATPSDENPCTITVHVAWNSVTFVSAPLEVGKAYKFVLTSATENLRATIYMLDSNHVVKRRIGNYLGVTSIASSPTVAEGEVYFAIYCTANVATTLTLTNVMLQVATADFNTYEPYRVVDSVEWEAYTLRAAGSVADMLYSDHVDVRVGVVDLGALNWSEYTGDASGASFVTAKPDDVAAKSQFQVPDFQCAKYEAKAFGGSVQTWVTNDKAICQVSNSDRIIIRDTDYESATAVEFRAAMSGVLLFYALATPTTTPISPLPMTYRVKQGGTESIVVPAGEISAVPIITLAEGESAADVVMDALACIAAPDGPVATANHAVNTYLTMGGKLYKVTRAIAVGETITAGTSVAQTTVMDELIALTA